MSRDFRAGLLVGVVITILGIAFIGNLAKVFAEEWAVLMLRSHHFEDKNYEEQNYGVGIEKSLPYQTRLAVGIYRNSERNTSLYGAGVYCPLTSGNWRGCGLVGGVTGYADSVAPLAGLVLAYEGKEWGANLLVLPNKRGDFSQGVIAIQAKLKWD